MEAVLTADYHYFLMFSSEIDKGLNPGLLIMRRLRGKLSKQKESLITRSIQVNVKSFIFNIVQGSSWKNRAPEYYKQELKLESFSDNILYCTTNLPAGKKDWHISNKLSKIFQVQNQASL